MYHQILKPYGTYILDKENVLIFLVLLCFSAKDKAEKALEDAAVAAAKATKHANDAQAHADTATVEKNKATNNETSVGDANAAATRAEDEYKKAKASAKAAETAADETNEKVMEAMDLAAQFEVIEIDESQCQNYNDTAYEAVTNATNAVAMAETAFEEARTAANTKEATTTEKQNDIDDDNSSPTSTTKTTGYVSALILYFVVTYDIL